MLSITCVGYSRKWKKLSCGSGTKGQRFYQWAFIPFGILTERGLRKGLLVRRCLKNPEELAYYFTHAPKGTTLARLVCIAGSRWAIEECFEQAKQETGLDEYGVRSWTGWYMTGWRIGEILALQRENLDLSEGIAFVPAEETKGKCDARVELNGVVVNHIEKIVGFDALVFSWPHNERLLWVDFATLKEEAGVEFPGAFHRFRLGYANANVDRLDADILQHQMRHKDPKTTRRYIHQAERVKRSGVAEKTHAPDFLTRSID